MFSRVGSRLLSVYSMTFRWFLSQSPVLQRSHTLDLGETYTRRIETVTRWGRGREWDRAACGTPPRPQRRSGTRSHSRGHTGHTALPPQHSLSTLVNQCHCLSLTSHVVSSDERTASRGPLGEAHATRQSPQGPGDLSRNASLSHPPRRPPRPAARSTHAYAWHGPR